MTPLDLALTVGVPVLVAGLTAGLLLFFQRGKASAGGDLDLRAANTALERDLAVHQERLAKLPQLEATLAAVEAQLAAELLTKGQLGADLAGMSAAKAALETTSSELKARLATAETNAVEVAASLQAAERARADLRTELAKLQETLDQERRASAEKLQLLTDAKESMSKDFQVLANDVMSRHGEAFTKQNKEQLDGLLTPLRDKLNEFQTGLQTAHTETVKDRAALGEQIRQLSDQSAKMTSETLNLTRALKGKVQTQGAWGEMILESLLQKSGLREGEEYVSQSSHSTDDGQRLRPDVIVNLPNSQRVIIDAKVSLTAFETYVNAETEEARSSAATAHLASMRSHIKRLASKEYQTLAGDGLDYVILFVPIEGALAVALEIDPNLTGYAVQNNVAIATPTTLMIALRTIDNVWQVERRNRNAEAIAVRAGHLYNKFVGFVDDLQKVGQRLDTAKASYDAAMGKLQTGSGNLVGQAETLRKLGAKTTKVLPEAMRLEDLSEPVPLLEEATDEGSPDAPSSRSALEVD